MNLKIIERLKNNQYCPYDKKCGQLYECTKEEYQNMCNANTKLSLENQELKKQLEEYKKKLMIATKMEIKEIDKNIFVGIDYFQNKCSNYEVQQKEFIKYLEEKRDKCLTFYEKTECAYAYDVFKVVLSKYKEINHIEEVDKMVGGKDEKEIR